MTDEREQIVAFLRRQADTGEFTDEQVMQWIRELTIIYGLAAKIERGDHLKESPHG